MSTLIAEGRYHVFFSGSQCGEECWRIDQTDDGYVATGEQVLMPPHPLPHRQEYRIALTSEWRVISVDIQLSVGTRRLVATHRADGERWHGRIDVDGHAREQRGDYPVMCEVETPTHLANTFLLAKRDFALDGEHEFTALRIGPPLMAVEPARMLCRCVEVGTYDTPLGPVSAKRYVLSLTGQAEGDRYAFWADDHGIVLESYEGIEATRPWMRLVEYRRPLG
jgi:hypothetical protein